MQTHPNYKYRPRRRKQTKRGGRRTNEVLMPSSNGEDSYNAQFGAFHTPDASPNASPDPDVTKEFSKGSIAGNFIFFITPLKNDTNVKCVTKL